MWDNVTTIIYYYPSILPLYEVALYSNPIIPLNTSCLSFTKAFVRISVTIYCVGHYSNSTTLFLFFSLMKWCCTSICYDLSWFVGFLVRATKPWVSHMIVVASTYRQFTYSINCLTPNSPVHWLVHINSASIIECATSCCNSLYQHTVPSPTKKVYLDVVVRFFISPAQSTLEYPLRLICLMPMCNLISNAPFKYPMIFLTTIQFIGPNFHINLVY